MLVRCQLALCTTWNSNIIFHLAQSLSPLATPTFLHLSHPSALYNLQEGVSHVRRFRDHLGGLSAKGENAQIAKDVLMDVVDCCGVDLKALVGFLDDALVNARKLNGKLGADKRILQISLINSSS